MPEMTSDQILAAFGMRAPKKAQARTFRAPSKNEAQWRARLANQGQLSAHKPTAGERIETGLGGVLGKVVGDQAGKRLAGRAMAPLNDLTPVGNVTGAADGATQFANGIRRGHLAQAALGAGAFALSVIPGSQGAKRVTGNVLGKLLRDEAGAIRAYHGSPYDFDKFDAAKIGTGEGNQAYGRGLYFADSPGVAGSYVQPRSNEPQEVPAEIKQRLHQLLQQDDYLGFDSYSEAVHAIRTSPTDFDRAWEVTDAPAIRSALDAYDTARWPQGQRPRLYEVEIDAEPEDFVDWDALGAANAQRAAQEPGVKGIKFLDGGSRHQGGGSYNYVVQDPSLLRILNKY